MKTEVILLTDDRKVESRDIEYSLEPLCPGERSDECVLLRGGRSRLDPKEILDIFRPVQPSVT